MSSHQRVPLELDFAYRFAMLATPPLTRSVFVYSNVGVRLYHLSEIRSEPWVYVMSDVEKM